ncbi:putative effector protein [Erysiphe necator]|uniref:Putative effector protein n=1 Tax=Uncinula necator TaxID=52586 RepID=A0A0B1PB91_UNCNE|nr:putative effector protein [Erysiphe necator]
MAPPLGSKRALPPDPPDAGNRVSKPKPTSGKTSRTNVAKNHLLLKTVDASCKGVAIEKVPSEGQGSTDHSYESDDSMESAIDDRRDHEHLGEDFPALPRNTLTTAEAKIPSPSNNSSSKSQGSAASLMGAIKGLLDLTNDYLKNLEIEHPGIGPDFLALIADGASRAMRGERVYRDLSRIEPTQKHPVQETWAEKAKDQSADTKVFNLKRKTLKATPPQGQSKEDRRVMIRLKPDHEARKSGSFELRQTIQKLVPETSLVSDAWIVPSGIAVLAPTPAKAAAILQAKKAIEDRFGNALVERQEAWTTFVIGPINKRIRCLDGTQDPMDGLLQEELAHIRDTVPIRDMGWTRRSQNEEPYGYIRICVPESKAGKFPSRLRIFGEAVSIQRIRKREHVHGH